MGLSNRTPMKLATTAIFTSLVAVATIVFSIYVPSTQGFFNIGESMIYLTAILYGPLIGGFAGGVGSMFADLYLGYAIYAPATLVVKAVEGFIVGFIMSKKPDLSLDDWKKYSIILGIIPGLLLALIGSRYYSGEVEIYLLESMHIISVSSAIWVLAGFLLAALVIGLSYKVEPDYGWTVLSVISGGICMVSGYFIYQQFLIGPLFNVQGIVAIAEVPINFGQVLVGTILALPLSQIIKRTIPSMIK